MLVKLVIMLCVYDFMDMRKIMDFTEIIINNNYKGVNPVQFGHADCPPEWSFGPAVRDHWLLHYVVSGTGYFERDGKKHKVKQGEFFVIPPYLETYYIADKNDPWHYIWIGFTTEMDLPEIFCKPIVRMSGAGEVFKEMLLCRNMENGKSAFLTAQLWKLMSLALETGDYEPDHIEKAISFMNSEYMNGISVSDIAKQLSLDRSYFTTLFTRKIGVSPGQYLLDLRLTKAANLMTLYGESPTTASFSVGYSDIYHFSKAFKKKYGCSPRAYKKSRQQ